MLLIWKIADPPRAGSGAGCRTRSGVKALERPELSPRKLAITFTDEKAAFISEASVYRLLRANGLLTSLAFIATKAANEFREKTTAPDQLWQTDFTYLKVIGWDGSTCRPFSTTSPASS